MYLIIIVAKELVICKLLWIDSSSRTGSMDESGQPRRLVLDNIKGFGRNTLTPTNAAGVGFSRQRHEANVRLEASRGKDSLQETMVETVERLLLI